MQDEFIGAGWAFPLGVSATGGIALVRREQELEQAMRLILRRIRASARCGPSSVR